MKNALVAGILLVVVVFAIFQSFQISAIKNGLGSSEKVSKSASSGETYEEMMARMHPDQVKAGSSQQQATRYSASASQSPQMVGGC